MIIPILESEEYLTIDESFQAHYGVFKNNASYLYPTKFWGQIKKWTAYPFVPSDYFIVKEGTDNDIEYACFEHVSVCINGSADFILQKANDQTQTYTFHWTFGTHNVDNGWGYLPSRGYMLNKNYNNFETCCIIQNDNGRDPSLPRTKFEVLSDNATITLSKNYKWVHVACGSINLNGNTYSKKQTVYDVANNSTINFASNTIIITAQTE